MATAAKVPLVSFDGKPAADFAFCLIDGDDNRTELVTETRKGRTLLVIPEIDPGDYTFESNYKDGEEIKTQPITAGPRS